jgi:hypothetical protein
LNKAAGKGNSARHIEEPPFKGKLNGKPVDLPGVKVRKILYKKRERLVYEQLRKIFNATIRKSFVKSLANSPEKISHLRKAGLTDIDIAKLKNGKIPAGYQVHHKLPLDDGGTNEFENLVLIKNDPYHKAITNTQNALVGDLRPGGSKLIDFPVIEGFVYPPGH